MLDGGGPAGSRPIRVPTTMLMNIVLVRKQNKTKNKKSTTPAAAAAAFTEEHPSPSAFSLLSLHLTAPGKVFFAPVPPRDTTHVREDHAKRNSDAVQLRRTSAKKEKKKTTTTTCRYPRVCSLSRFCPSALTGLE
jgi:hypothetical protein